jgi:radical SAM superfamily enzyme YgiQ (UPF0313 family)
MLGKDIDLAFVYPSRAAEAYSLLYAPLALPYLGRHTPSHYRITLHDEFVGGRVDPDRLRTDLVAFSAMTPGIARSYELADSLRARGVTCVAGGPHVSSLPEEALQHFDAIVIGEGEWSWPSLLGDFEAGRIQRVYRTAPPESLDDLGRPRRELIHPAYRFPSVTTSRGCRHRCSFCYLTALGSNNYRRIPHEVVLEDLERLRGEDILIVVDENFVGDGPGDFADRKILLDRMISRRFGHLWGCQATVAVARDRELMRLLYRAGCRAVFIGFETASREGLAEIGKHHNEGVDYRDVVRRLHRHGIAVIASCILGLDSQDRQYPRELVRALKRAEVDFTRVFYLTAWPGTPLFERLDREGRVSRDWDRVRKDVPSLVYRHFSPDSLRRARDLVLREMLGVSYVLRVLLRWIFRERSLVRLFLVLVRQQRPRGEWREKA